MIFSLSDAPHARLLPSQQEMKRFDQQTIAAGTAAGELMERAGVEVFRELKERFSFELYSNGRVIVLAGPGNNGGDGLVIARHLKDHGYEVVVVLASSASYSQDLVNQIRQFRQKEGMVVQFPELHPVADDIILDLASAEDLQGALRGSSVLVDALLGTGQNDLPRKAVASILEQVRTVRDSSQEFARVVAVDMPTGINGDTGEVYTDALRADLTISIELIKRGMLQHPARSLCGDIWVVKIGLVCDRTQFSLLDKSSSRSLRPRPLNSHKGDFGTVLIVGGSEDMPGAPFLAAAGALRSGTGSVTKVHLRGSATPGFLPEIMLATVGDRESAFAPKTY